jgi:hypothetical protein
MNFKTTLVLLMLAVAGGALFWLGIPQLSRPTPGSDAGTLSFLTDLTPERLRRVDVQSGTEHVTLERGPGGDWSLPGKWPTRKLEVEGLIHVLTGLESRFAPLPLHETTPLDPYGLAQPPVLITLQVGDQVHHLAFGEEPGENNRFSRPTYMHLDDKPEVVRLAPGLVATLQRHQDYYQLRRLFPSERIVKEGESTEREERLTARSVAVQNAEKSYSLTRVGEEWELRTPVHDHADPDKLRAILTAVPDIWAEQFVTQPKKDLAAYGLKAPEQRLEVIRPNGDTVVLLIGKPSQVKTRTVTRPAPNLGGPPMPPQREVLHEEYRYAKLENNSQVFEIKADKLKDVLVTPDLLRDARLVRFRTEDVRRIEVSQSGQNLILLKEGALWKIQKPWQADAESSKVTELLDKLTFLQARDKDILDKVDRKSCGLEAPTATIQVAVEEDKGTANAKKKERRTYTFLLGKHDTEKAKLYVQLAGWGRVNLVEDSLLKLVERPALTYRGRRIFDFAAADLAKVDIWRNTGALALQRNKDSWRLVAPVDAEIDRTKVDQLTGDLGHLEAVDYISALAAPDRLDREFGLTHPALSVTLHFMDSKKPVQTLLIGSQQAAKPEYYAKLASAPGVFIIKKEIRDALNQDSLAYRPLQLWQVQPDSIREVRVQKVGPEYHLRHEGQTWHITGPFDAPVPADQLRPITDELVGLRCERYIAHDAKHLANYGLEKPYLRVVVRERIDEKAARERVLIIGKPTEKDSNARYAKLGDNPSVFVIGAKAISALDHEALDFLDRDLLALDEQSIEEIKGKGAGGGWLLQRHGGEWRVTESPAPPFTADHETVASLLGAWSHLRALRFASYGSKHDLAAYGLDKPAATLTVALKPPPGAGKTSPTVEHTLVLGKRLDNTGERYARLDSGPGIAVFNAALVSDLTHGYLDFVNRSLLHFDAGNVTALQRRMGAASLEVAKRPDGWHLIKPGDLPADEATFSDLIQQLAALRGKRVAAYPARDLKAFGLDDPTSIITVRLAAKAGEHTVKIGKPTGDSTAPDDRYAQVDQGTTVMVLPGSLVRRLTAPPLEFRNRNLVRFPDADRITLTRGNRKAVFSKVDGSWKLTQPVQADAEQADLDDFLNQAAHLHAEELIADKPTNLSQYGLDRPQARWQFQTGDKMVLDLIIGKVQGSRCFAKLGQGDVVFLLSAPMTTRVLGEYRSRSVWPPLDAVQIERLSYGGEHPFTLEKADQDWRVTGKSVKVRPETIRDTLDAFAGLKATRYVADTDPDLKLYGLEPPQLIIEIQTPSGKRVIHIGRREGESGRYYARVPEPNSMSVFIIAESDASRILRPLASFTGNPGNSSASVH